MSIPTTITSAMSHLADSKARYLVDGHEISISVKYSFGKVKETEFKGKSINENENRIR